MLIIGLSCMFVSALEIVAEISNTFPDRKDAKGYIVWYNIFIGAIIALFGMACCMNWFFRHGEDLIRFFLKYHIF